MYAANTWNAAHFPFLSQQLFYENGTLYSIASDSSESPLSPRSYLSVVPLLFHFLFLAFSSPSPVYATYLDPRIRVCGRPHGRLHRGYHAGTIYDQLSILNPDYSLNKTALDEQGLPWYAASNAIYYLGCNLAIGATLTHVGL